MGNACALGAAARVEPGGRACDGDPDPSVCVILAVQFQTAEQEMASTLFFSTVLSLPTMGLFIWLMGG
jgi:hypothetical protein